MSSKEEIPFHYYTETTKYVTTEDDHPIHNIKPDFPFIITQFGVMHDRAQTEMPHRHDYFELIFIKEGEGQHIIDYEPFEIKPPAFFFLSKGQIHLWKLTKSLKGEVLLFPREFLIPWSDVLQKDDDLLIFNSLSNASQVSVEGDALNSSLQILENIKNEFSRESDRNLSVLRSYTHILLVHLLRVHAKSQTSNILDDTNVMVRKFRQLVSENYLLVRSVQEYADLIGISTTHLRDTVKSVTGYSPGQIIRQEIIFEAKRRLANTEATTAEIGYGLNFEDTSYFSRFFKRETGVSPTNYREKIRKKYQIKV